MTIITFFLYLCFSAILFLLLNIKVNKENNLRRIYIPIIYIIILAALFFDIGFYQFNNNIFLILIFELIFRLYYVNYVLKQDLSIYAEDFWTYFLSITIGYLINVKFINKVDSILPTAVEIRQILWLLIIYVFIDKLRRFNTHKSDKLVQKDKKVRDEYYISSYTKMKIDYHDELKKYKNIKYILYSIMIYENYKRPVFLRNIDNIRNRHFIKKTKQGIMQVESKKIIDDIESIEIVAKKLQKLEEKLKLKKFSTDKLNIEIIKSYYSDNGNCDEILKIYNLISDFEKIK